MGRGSRPSLSCMDARADLKLLLFPTALYYRHPRRLFNHTAVCLLHSPLPRARLSAFQRCSEEGSPGEVLSVRPSSPRELGVERCEFCLPPCCEGRCLPGSEITAWRFEMKILLPLPPPSLAAMFMHIQVCYCRAARKRAGFVSITQKGFFSFFHQNS